MNINIKTNNKAFGDGMHASTELAASMLSTLAQSGACPRKILDMGSGSGILSLAALSYFENIKITAADIEPESVEATRHNIDQNFPDINANILRSDGYSNPKLKENAPYDLIICNMLTEPIIKYAYDAAKMLGDRGFIILSGIITWQKDNVIKAHEMQGLQLIAEASLEDWWSILLRK